METLREEVNAKLSHILRDIKELQKTIIHIRQEERRGGEERISKWLTLGKEISGWPQRRQHNDDLHPCLE